MGLAGESEIVSRDAELRGMAGVMAQVGRLAGQVIY